MQYIACKATTSGACETTKRAKNEKDEQGRTKITVFAVVDPYNLIDETNERNNLLSCTGYLDCD